MNALYPSLARNNGLCASSFTLPACTTLVYPNHQTVKLMGILSLTAFLQRKIYWLHAVRWSAVPVATSVINSPGASMVHWHYGSDRHDQLQPR